MFTYPRWEIDARVWWQYLFPASAVVLLAVLLAWRRRWGRGPLAATLFFGGTLLPALGFVNVYPMRFSFVANHFQYLASIGPIVLISALLGRSRSTAIRRLAYVPLLPLAALTFLESRDYRDDEHLWRVTLKKNPTAWIAHNNIAIRHAAREEIDKAIEHLTLALQTYPYYAEGQSNLGMMLFRTGRLDEALAHLREAVRLDPGLADAYSNLGLVLVAQGRYDEALRQFHEAIRLKPTSLVAQYNLGCVLLGLGRVEEAITTLRAAERLDPRDEQVQERLQAALREQARLKPG